IEPNSTSVKLSWTSVSGVEGYNLELASNTAFTNVLSTINIGVQTSYTFDSLTSDTKYYVRVRAVKNTPNLHYSDRAVYDFTTKDLRAEEAWWRPGAIGFRKLAPGGRGGNIIKVMNLNGSGSGSLRDAINLSAKRIAVFEVSGNIKLQCRL